MKHELNDQVIVDILREKSASESKEKKQKEEPETQEEEEHTNSFRERVDNVKDKAYLVGGAAMAPAALLARIKAETPIQIIN